MKIEGDVATLGDGDKSQIDLTQIADIAQSDMLLTDCSVIIIIFATFGGLISTNYFYSCENTMQKDYKTLQKIIGDR